MKDADLETGENHDVAERRRLEELDLSPAGLADAPASQQDPDSIVYIGTTD